VSAPRPPWRAQPVRALCLLAALVSLVACSVERTEAPQSTRAAGPATDAPLLGLRSGIYHVADLTTARAWYSEVLGHGPYFDEPYYVGFTVGGFELGLSADTASVRPGPGGAVVYWGVRDADQVLARLLELGAHAVEPVTDVGGGIRHAIVRDPFGNLLGIMENPHFAAGR
jgi:predicted enzyme related to lactoylglutathione lyase